MSNEELARAFAEGRLSRRAFVRQLVDGGMPMSTALSYADTLVPSSAGAPSTVGAPSSPPNSDPGTRPELSSTPTRVAGVVLDFVGDGYLVYLPGSDRMHSLNHTAALVLELCTGGNDQSEIAGLLQRSYQLPQPPEEETRQCLATLHHEGLIY